VKVHVLDTSALVGGLAPGLVDARLVTVREVLEEARSLEVKSQVETAMLAGRIEVVEASPGAVKKVREILKRTGDRLSRADVHLLALALDFKSRGAILLTDDYALQNLATRLGVVYQGLRAPGIRRVLSWEAVCPGCGKKFRPPFRKCPVCGTKLERKPKKFIN
jgi:UPF0271 protein